MNGLRMESHIHCMRKYNLDEDVVVVEKSNAYKFTVTVLINVIKTLATIIILILAAIGLITLIYPTTKKPFCRSYIP